MGFTKTLNDKRTHAWHIFRIDQCRFVNSSLCCKYTAGCVPGPALWRGMRMFIYSAIAIVISDSGMQADAVSGSPCLLRRLIFAEIVEQH